MKTWDIRSLDIQPRKPEILHSEEEGRAIAVNLPAGEALDDHQVHEHAWVFVADGEVEIEGGEETKSAGPGFLAHFEPNERHEVRATSDALLLLLLAPWPGEGHPSTRQ